MFVTQVQVKVLKRI